MAIEMAAVLIPVAIFTVTGRTMVSPTAQVEELNVPMVVVMGACANKPFVPRITQRIETVMKVKTLFIWLTKSNNKNAF
jgi:Ca2+/H+ antiporter